MVFAHVDWLHEGQQVAYREGHSDGTHARKRGVPYALGLPRWARGTPRAETGSGPNR
jgi:hypothetical protein